MEIGHNLNKSSLIKGNEFFINPSAEQLKEFAANKVMKDFQKNLGPEDQQPILTESERLAAIKKEKDEFENRKKVEIKGLPAEMKAEVCTYRVSFLYLASRIARETFKMIENSRLVNFLRACVMSLIYGFL